MPPLNQCPERDASCRGVYFDLNLIFHDLNNRFFDEKIAARLRWGQRRTLLGAKKFSIRLGSYQDMNKTITIHPSLDQAMVPTICVERIIFHEMLHQHLPPKKGKDGRNLVHHREFNDFEKKYPYLFQADMWIKANLYRLLRF